VTAAEYLAQPCSHGRQYARVYCSECLRADATELLALRERAAQWDGKAPGLERINAALRAVLYEFAIASDRSPADKYYSTLKIDRDTIAEARRLALE